MNFKLFYVYVYMVILISSTETNKERKVPAIYAKTLSLHGRTVFSNDIKLICLTRITRANSQPVIRIAKIS